MSNFNKSGKKDRFKKKEKPEFDQTIVDLARVTRVTKGGKQLSFRVCVLIGDRRGRVGYGVEKGKDVQIAVDKAVNQAKKNLIVVPFDDVSIPHRVEAKYKSGKVMVKPAPQGSGIIAGSSVRTVLEMAGVPNASAKILGKTNNKIVNIKAIFKALQSFKPSAVKKMMENKNKKQVVKQVNGTKTEKNTPVLLTKKITHANVPYVKNGNNQPKVDSSLVEKLGESNKKEDKKEKKQ